MTRSEARELGFILIFEKQFSDEPLDELVSSAEEIGGYTFNDFSLQLARCAIENLEPVDAIIEKYLKGWTMNRISRIALSILRLAVSEIVYFDDIPESVSINEAIELSKKYGADDDPAFVNGVLGSFSRQRASQSDTQQKSSDNKEGGN